MPIIRGTLLPLQRAVPVLLAGATLAGIAWLLAGEIDHKLFPPAPPAIPDALTDNVETQASAIAARHLFGIPSLQTTNQVAPGQIQLLGVLAAGRNGIAIIRIDTGQPLQVKTGEVFGSAYRLLGLHADRAEIEGNGGRFEIALAKIGGTSRPDEIKP